MLEFWRKIGAIVTYPMWTLGHSRSEVVKTRSKKKAKAEALKRGSCFEDEEPLQNPLGPRSDCSMWMNMDVDVDVRGRRLGGMTKVPYLTYSSMTQSFRDFLSVL